MRAEDGSTKKQSKSGSSDEIEKSDDEELDDQKSADIIEEKDKFEEQGMLTEM